ncbi:topology modulation protein [Chungangia koreensis]|uniref:Topology modulation protein n=1 Tax=Chungangia koreensis TaxID=752657 RepID=A0ABV8X4L1_9LACT
MKRIMVIGVSSGVGKSTFAKNLGEALNIPAVHLDSLFWKPGWVEASVEEFKDAQREVVLMERWVIDGNYSNSYDVRERHADTVIYLELPLRICLYRVFKRYWMNRGTTRPDLGEGCTEKLDVQFLKFIITTYKRRKNQMADRLRRYEEEGKTVIVLKSKEEIASFLEKVRGLT